MTLRPLRNYLTATIIDKPKTTPIILLSDIDENPHLLAIVDRVGPDVKEAKPGDTIECRERTADYREGNDLMIREADIAFIHETPLHSVK